MNKWLNVAYFFLFSIKALCTAITLSFVNVDWPGLSSTSKFLIVVMVLASWSDTMLAFLFKTIERAAHGKPIIGNGDTPPDAGGVPAPPAKPVNPTVGVGVGTK